MAQKCCLCNLEFKNDEQYKQHIDGKKHKKLESIKLEREKTAQRSIFVSNLKKDIFQKHLEEHFERFGKINKIVVDQEKNAYAIIEYESEESVEKCLALPNEHQINEKNLKVSRREIKEFVSKLPNHSEKRKEVLDKVKEEALNVNKLLGACESFDEQVDKLIEYLKLDEEHLKLRHQICESLRKILCNFWNENELKVCIFGSTSNGLACNGSDMDLTILFNQYLVENRHKQQKVPSLKSATLKAQNSNGQDSSDSNMVELDEDINLEENNDDENDHSLKAALEKFFNEKNYNQFNHFELDHQIKIIARILQRFYLEAKTIRTISNARCPVVSFQDSKAKISCDITLNNFLAYENTKLIQLYMDLEPNLQRMIYVIRYWMKHKNLYSSSRFNSYTIIWLIIFYMQQKKIAYLPTVDQLSKMTNQVNEIHGWNCSFEMNVEKIKSMKSEGQIQEANNLNDLLKGFYEFYSTFDFAPNKILVTRTAEISTDIEKTSLSKISLLNVQDPFDLSHNLSANISKNTIERFVAECKSSNDLLQYSKPPRRCTHKGWGLILLTTLKPLAIQKAPQITPKELVEKSMFKLKLFDEPNGEMNKNQDMTVRKAIEFVLFLFKDCLFFGQMNANEISDTKRKRFKMLNQICDKVDLLGLNCSPKRLKVGHTTSDDPSKASNTYVCVMDENVNNNNDEEAEDKNEKLVSSFLFSARNNTWQGRRNIKREFKQKAPHATDIEIESLVSKKLQELNANKPENVAINFRVKFSIDSALIGEAPGSENHANLKIKFDMLDETTNQNDLINFTTLAHFLDIYINNCHEKFFTQWNLTHSN